MVLKASLNPPLLLVNSKPFAPRARSGGCNRGGVLSNVPEICRDVNIFVDSLHCKNVSRWIFVVHPIYVLIGSRERPRRWFR